MPYGKLPLNVIRNYNLLIVDTDRYRMLKEIRNSRMLKSKGEVAACNDFASCLIKLQKDNFTDKKIVLVFFEPRHSQDPSALPGISPFLFLFLDSFLTFSLF
jgi:maternal-effect protein exuperantia